ncbi:glycosylhydrolase-like jelly roll fold domain-containing protein [Sphingobium rhizovicinum]|uniref:Glycosylhydrolase-like jelly roll fold domain-containing protein n=1 Tax=Sphingobium rhizovicinum TaxID=432308 RepID=A0ABV7NKP8_9SPHN
MHFAIAASPGWSETGGPWVNAPAEIAMKSMAPPDSNSDPRVRYFSGEAIYSSSFALPGSAKPGAPLWLDLGRIGDVADVRVNGHLAGANWFAPYRIDVGKLVKPGRNAIEVKIANLWVNRLIGDQQAGAERVTFTAVPTYRPDAPLRPSGLIGAVTLLAN